MSRDGRPATAEEDAAVNTVREVLIGPKSLANRLRGGEALDRDFVSQLLRALDLLASTWSARPSIPKRLAEAFVDVQTPLLQAPPAHDIAQRNAVEDAANEIVDAIYSLLEDQGDSQEASPPTGSPQTLHEGLATANSLQYKLRTGLGLDNHQLKELRSAFRSLILEYNGRSEIPKRVAAACVDLPWSMLQGLDRYGPEQVAQISAASTELTALARHLLGTQVE